MMKLSHRRMSHVGFADRRVMIALAIAICSSAALAHAQGTSEAPRIPDIRLMRKLGDYGQALEYARALLADGATSADDRKQAYNEIVTIAFAAEGKAAARSAARDALIEFPDLSADPAYYPIELLSLYDDLRKELFGRLHLASDPSGCAVSMGDRMLGSTPLEGVFLPVGNYVLLIKNPDFADDTICVAIAAGAESKRFVEMRRLRDTIERRIIIEAALSVVSLQYDGNGGTAGDASATRFGGGAFFHAHAHDRLAYQVGVRYSSQGDAELSLHYLAAPASFKLYPFARPRVFACLGIEPAYLLSASRTESEGGESTDILERLQRVQVSLIIGAGCEIPLGGHYLSISAYRIMGQMSLRKPINYEESDYVTREWKMAIGFLL